MRIIEKLIVHSTVNGDYSLQLEDWSNDYPSVYAKNALLAAYPVAKSSNYGEHTTYPKRGQTFRLSMQFASEAEARTAMQELSAQKKILQDFIANFEPSPNLGRYQIMQCLQD